MSAATPVKVLSPEITPCCRRVKGFISWKPASGRALKGECVTGGPGSKSVAGKSTVCVGTWENRSVPFRSPREAEKAGRGYDVTVVGLTRSRGVNRVMPAEDIEVHSKGSAFLTLRVK